MKKSWEDWLIPLSCGAIVGGFAAYAYVKLKLLIEIWRAICR